MSVWPLNSMQMVIMSSLFSFIGLLVLLILMRTNPLFNKMQNAIFNWVVWINLSMIVVVAADFMLSSSHAETAWIWRRITSFLNFSCSPILPLLLYKIFDKKKDGILLYLPALINLVLCFFSIFFRLVFFISEDNKYGRGPLFYVPFGTSLLYIAIIFLKPNRFQLQSKRVERLVLMVIVSMLLLAMYLEIAAKMRLLIWNSSAMGIILYYLLLNIHNFILDPLTGVYNRIKYSNVLNSLNGVTPCLIALVDINNFKLINDNFGHEAGDQCLVKFSGILVRCFQGCAIVYRIGGDEFVLIGKGVNNERFQECLERSRGEAAQEGIQFACGIVHYDGKSNIENALHQMDQSMYENKSSIKRA